MGMVNLDKYVATVDFLDWSASLGGEHIEATLYYQGQFIKMEYEISTSEAIKFNKKDSAPSYARYKKGDKSKRFFTYEQAYEFVTKYVNTNFPDVKIIFEIDEWNPRRVVWCIDPSFKKLFMECYETMEILYKKTHSPDLVFPEATKNTYKAFDLVKKLFLECIEKGII